MGNTVVIPSFTDIESLPLKSLHISLEGPIGSGSFFQVFDGQDSNGNKIIVKIYEYTSPIRDLPTTSESNKYFTFLSSNTSAASGVLPYSAVHVDGNFAILVRPQYDATLVETLSFQSHDFSHIELLWIAYQLSMAVTSLHFLKIPHGNIKPSNVLLNTYLRVLLTDLAPFKPARIPMASAHLYQHYFTTSSQTGCYIAPERISDVNTNITDADFLIMADLFSLGCVIAYIFQDGTDLFDLPTLIAYGKGDVSIESRISGIRDQKMRDFISILLDLDPVNRQEAIYQMESFFPPEFSDIYAMSEKEARDRIEEIERMPSVNTAPVLLNVLNEAVVSPDNSINSMLCAVKCFRNLSQNLNDSTKILKVFPFLLMLFENPHNIVKSAALNQTLEIYSSLASNQPEISSVILSRVQACAEKSDIYMKMILADFIPRFAVILSKTAPENLTRVLVISNIICNPLNPRVFDVFTQSLINTRGNFKTFYGFLLSNLNTPSFQVLSSVLACLRAFYENRQRNEMSSIKSEYTKSISTVACELFLRPPVISFVPQLIDFIIWLNDNSLIHPSMYPSLALKAIELGRTTTDPSIIAACESMKECFPSDLYVTWNLKNNPDFHAKSKLQNAKILAEKPQQSFAVSGSKFLASIKGKTSTIIGSVEARSDMVITADSTGILSWICIKPEDDRSPLTVNMSKMSRVSISTLTCVSNHKQIATGHINGSVMSYDINTGKKTVILEPSDIKISNLIDSDDGLLLVTEDGTVKLIDIRTKSTGIEMKLKYGKVTSSTVLGRSSCSVGFDIGKIVVIDSRVMSPFWMLDVQTPLYMSPYDSGRLGVAVSSEYGVQTYDIDSGAGKFVPSPRAVITNYKGGIIGINSGLGFYLRETDVVEILESRTPIEMTGNVRISYAPPHGHYYKPTCCTTVGEYLVSGDELGFVNLWKVW